MPDKPKVRYDPPQQNHAKPYSWLYAWTNHKPISLVINRHVSRKNRKRHHE